MFIFKKVSVDQDGIYIRVEKIKGNSPKEVKDPVNKLTCKECGFVAKNENGLRLHNRKHKK